MKWISLLTLLISFHSAFAIEQCPNFSGTYMNKDTGEIQTHIQINCERMSFNTLNEEKVTIITDGQIHSLSAPKNILPFQEYVAYWNDKTLNFFIVIYKDRSKYEAVEKTLVAIKKDLHGHLTIKSETDDLVDKSKIIVNETWAKLSY